MGADDRFLSCVHDCPSPHSIGRRTISFCREHAEKHWRHGSIARCDVQDGLIPMLSALIPPSLLSIAGQAIATDRGVNHWGTGSDLKRNLRINTNRLRDKTRGPMCFTRLDLFLPSPCSAIVGSCPLARNRVARGSHWKF